MSDVTLFQCFEQCILYNFDLAFISYMLNSIGIGRASYSHGHRHFHYPIPVVFIFKFAVVRERQLPVQPLQRGVRAKCPSSSSRESVMNCCIF
jgi:hypothetical protein